MVTNHNALGYFAAAYDFEIVGTVIPGGSTLSEPAAGELAELVAEIERLGICTIFIGVTGNDELPEAVLKEVDSCESVRLVPLYTGTLGPAGSEADSYVKMMRANIDAIVEGLK